MGAGLRKTTCHSPSVEDGSREGRGKGHLKSVVFT